MKIFKTVCIDDRTKMELVASDCSYNAACFYIMNRNYEPTEIKSDFRNNRTLIVTKTRVFLYDEPRGLLLGN